MADFQPITTQEEFDARIKDRLERERNKFADYETLKADLASEREKSKGFDEIINANKTTISELTAKVAKYETDSAKTKIAIEHGLPMEWGNRLQGEDADAWATDAEAMAKYLKSPVQPLASTEPPIVDGEKAAYLRMLRK